MGKAILLEFPAAISGLGSGAETHNNTERPNIGMGEIAQTLSLDAASIPLLDTAQNE